VNRFTARERSNRTLRRDDVRDELWKIDRDGLGRNQRSCKSYEIADRADCIIIAVVGARRLNMRCASACCRDGRLVMLDCVKMNVTKRQHELCGQRKQREPNKSSISPKEAHVRLRPVRQ